MKVNLNEVELVDTVTGDQICKQEDLTLKLHLQKRNTLLEAARWELVSTSSSNSSKNDDLEDYLEDNSYSILNIPFDLLVNGSDYTFKATYIESEYTYSLSDIYLYQNIDDQ